MDRTLTGSDRRPGPAGLQWLLADTWWFGLTNRLDEARFLKLAALRVTQGFTGVQLVVGIPPEVRPDDPSAASPVGPAWSPSGAVNPRYLPYARERVEGLVARGLTPVIYGAWGHHVDWIGVRRMQEWWASIVTTFDDLPVVYCLTGESAIHADRVPRVTRLLARLGRPARGRQHRRAQWTEVLNHLSSLTLRPIVVHTTPDESGFQAVETPALLSADSFQSGHNPSSRDRLLELHSEAARDRAEHWINLEPWYEGIHDLFVGADQLFAYGVCMATGAMGHCYGAHGIWNVGDGRFLSHWGRQTFAQALALDAPRLMGALHREVRSFGLTGGSPVIRRQDSGGVRILRSDGARTLEFLSDARIATPLPAGAVWAVDEARYVQDWPASGPVMVFSSQGPP